MLPTQLQAIYEHLLNMDANDKELSKEQQKLLHELSFLNGQEKVFEQYIYHEIKLESFAPPSGICPNCGKKY